MNRVVICLTLGVCLLKAAPAQAPVHAHIFEPGAKPHEFVSRGSSSALRFTSAGVEFSAKDQPLVRLALPGSRAVDPAGDALLPSVTHYYLGRDRGNWRIGVANYARLVYKGVYPGIDLVFHESESGRGFEYDFDIAPNADPSRIRLRFDGANNIAIDSNGDLLVAGWLTHHRPRILQAGREIQGHFRVHRDRTVSFELAAYDRARPLVIDPVITYVSYLGGNSGDRGAAVQVDSSANVYVTGNTWSNNFPGIAVGTRPSGTAQFAYVSKFAPFANGKTQLLFTIVFGDNSSGGFTVGNSTAVDESGNIVMIGETDASELPVVNAYQSQLGGNGQGCITNNVGNTIPCPDGFVAKFSSDGKTMVFATYYGGPSPDSLNDVTTDASGNIYAAGYVTAPVAPLQATPNAVQPLVKADEDMVMVEFSGSGQVVYATFLGGSKTDFANSIALEKPGVVWIGGNTYSSDMPVPATGNGVQTTFSGVAVDAYFARIDTTKNGSAGLTYATFFNGTVNTSLAKLFLDPTGQVVFCGSTISDLPTTSTALEPNFAGLPLSEITSSDFTAGDAYLARINPAVAGSAGVTYATYVGGTDSDIGAGCAIDSNGKFIVTGYTLSQAPFLVTSESIPYKIFQGTSAYNAFLMQFPSTQAVYNGFLFGGENTDMANGLALDSTGTLAYLGGTTYSHFFPLTTTAVQPVYGGDSTLLNDNFGYGDAWLMQVNLNQAQRAISGLVQASGDFQFAAPGKTVNISTQIADANGVPVNLAGLPIQWTATNATTTITNPFTNASGIASVAVQLNSGNATVLAQVTNIQTATPLGTYTFHLAGISGTLPAAVSIASGNNQTGATGAALAQPLVVQLLDSNSNPLALAGITVQFQPSNATVGSATAVTDSTGKASTNVTLGSAAGAASVNIVVGSLAPVTANFTATSSAASGPAITQIVNGATFLAGPVSPGVFVTLKGTDLGPTTGIVGGTGSNNTFPTSLGGVQVFFNNVAAPLVYVSAAQINAIVPYEVAGQTSVPVTVEYQNATSAAQTVQISATALGLFSQNFGSGQGDILNQDNSVNSSANPAKRNGIVVLFGTGEGVTNPAGVDGLLATSVYPKPLNPITATIGGVNAPVLYYGAAPTLVAGVLQVNVQIPEGVPDGNAAIQLFEGSGQSPSTVTVAVMGDQ